MYTAEISRNNPSMILFLLDQSGSMQEVFDPENVQAMKEPVVTDGKTYTHSASGATKAEALADIINKLLQNFCIKCSRGEGGVWDYFHVGVIGYGMQVGPAFTGSLSGRELVPISEVAGMPARVETAHEESLRRGRRTRRTASEISDLVRRGSQRWDANVRGIAGSSPDRSGLAQRPQAFELFPAGRNQHHRWRVER